MPGPWEDGFNARHVPTGLRLVTDAAAEQRRRDRIVAEAEALVRIYRQRARTYSSLPLAHLRGLRDAVDWDGDLDG